MKTRKCTEFKHIEEGRKEHALFASVIATIPAGILLKSQVPNKRT